MNFGLRSVPGYQIECSVGELMVSPILGLQIDSTDIVWYVRQGQHIVGNRCIPLTAYERRIDDTWNVCALFPTAQSSDSMYIYVARDCGNALESRLTMELPADTQNYPVLVMMDIPEEIYPKVIEAVSKIYYPGMRKYISLTKDQCFLKSSMSQ